MAVYPKHGQSVNELIKNADTARYFAKAQGRKNKQVFSDSMQNDNLKRSHLVNSILSIARLMGMKVIAEGIETEQLAAYLGVKGCVAGQGRLFSEPMAAERLFVN